MSFSFSSLDIEGGAVPLLEKDDYQKALLSFFSVDIESRIY